MEPVLLARFLGEPSLVIGLVLMGAWPLGWWLSRVYDDVDPARIPLLSSLERLLYRAAGVGPGASMTWKTYAASLLVFHVFGLLLLVAILRLQGIFPWHSREAMSWWLAVNTATSFVTNTNWQAYGGETALGNLTQMVGLTPQNFLSASVGLAVMAALAREITGQRSPCVGNFWADLTRGVLYVLLPLSLVLSLLLVSQGVVQSLASSVTVHLLEPRIGSDGSSIVDQVLALGPAASQVAIKQLGTNGGGFFNANSAHPFENPTALSNLLEVVSILLLPAAGCLAFGRMVKDRRQGHLLLAVMLAILIPLMAVEIATEQVGNPLLASLGVDDAATSLQPGGNMEGKELRFGVVSSAVWATATTAASSGSVNAMHDSFTPIGGLVPMVLMQLGEVVLGGVGSGVYGMVLFVLLAVFAAGLMVGRTPEYLGKKVEVFDMKMACIGILLPAATVLVGTASGVALPEARASLLNPGAHGLSEALYAFSSAANNNGSAFGGVSADTWFWNMGTSLAMIMGRFGVLLPVLALAGSLSGKGRTPPGAGTLPTHTFMFGAFLIAVILLVGALTFIPALALGPMAEHLAMTGRF